MPSDEVRKAGVSLWLLAFAAVFITHWTTSAIAQNRNVADVPLALRPVDTSSPRDTLQGFLSDMEIIIEAWRRDELGEDAARARRRAIRTLDLSSTPHGDTTSVRSRHMLLLYEVLSRLPLPPFEEIPGDEEVAAKGITSWSIPNTAISIEQVAGGMGAGAFLFDAQTVENLERLYRHVEALPYQEGRMPGIFMDFLASGRTPYALARQVRNRLKPIDTSHPRSTLEGFLESVNRAHALVMTADAALRASPPELSIEEAKKIEQEASNLLRRAAGALDLSKTASALRQDVGLEAVLQLKETLDRIPLPPYDAVPGPGRVAAARSGEDAVRVVRWRIPNTKIDIVEITEGEREGEFLFSAGTVARIAEHYREVEDIPYRTLQVPFTATVDEAYVSPGVSPGFYEFYALTPGSLIPGTTWLGRFLDASPDWIKSQIGGQTLWQWIGLAFCFAVAIGTVIVVIPAVNRLNRRLRSPLDDWSPLLAPAPIALVVALLTLLVDRDLNITGDTLSVTKAIGTGTIFLMGAWAIYIVCKALGELIIRSPKILEESLDASLLRIAARVIGFLAGAWFAIARLSELGLDLLPLLAGLGVGGLAVALAAQRTLANFIGGLILYANKPVRIGDFCLFGNDMGTVEHIGLQTTRVRTLERSVISIPNGQFSEMQLTNLAPRDRRLIRTTLQLRYETTPEQMRFVLAELRAMLLGHPKVIPDPARVRFIGFGAYSKDVEVFAYLLCQDQNTFLAMQEDLLLRIDDIIEQAGTSFAFPSQTAYLARDAAPDAEQRRSAEQTVEEWRQAEKLPFPEFAQEEQKRLSNKLDYPPKGSPDFGKEPATKPMEEAQLSEASRLRRWMRLG